MELWDLYNRQRQLVGSNHVRGARMPNGCYHLVVHAWIRNRLGEFLVSQRSASCARLPLMWECGVGGSVLKEESSLNGVLREIEEEVGLTLPSSAGRLVSSEVRESGRFIRDNWLFDYTGPVCLKDATTKEVAQVKWLPRRQIKELLDSGVMVDDLQRFLMILYNVF